MLVPDDTANLTQHQLRVRLLRTQAHRDIVTGVMVQLLAIIMMMGSVGNASALFPLPFALTISTITLLSGFVFYFLAWRRDHYASRIRAA
ncbi:MAG: hypothetical protein AB7G17_01225 [Phycisphaerales bacterium]